MGWGAERVLAPLQKRGLSVKNDRGGDEGADAWMRALVDWLEQTLQRNQFPLHMLSRTVGLNFYKASWCNYQFSCFSFLVNGPF